MTSDRAPSNKERVLAQLRELQRLEGLERRRTEPVAIVGLGCRLPGGASSPEKFWSLLTDEVDAIREMPWDASLYDPSPDAPGKLPTKWGGFLVEPIDEFDAAFFGVSPREAQSMDPQQRLLLEVAVEAMQSAGVKVARPEPLPCGVFVGNLTTDYAGLSYADRARIVTHTAAGTAKSILANRLSYTLDLNGPSVVVDTACSSSLVAVDMACHALRLGRCDLALAGGVCLMLTPEASIVTAKVGALSPDGRCKSFDAAANGYARGEGCGVVVLKLLSAAVADGDTVLAVIRGSAVNQDGKTMGITAPNGLAQRRVLRAALQSARVEPSDVTYVEAHGTGTILGDPIEIEALAEVLGEGRGTGEPLAVGSVKSNIGHLEGAAGVAGLIKAVLCIRNRQIPANVHFKKPNPHIPFERIPVRVQTRLGPWPRDGAPLVAGVSSFGFGGTNAHVIVSEPPSPGDAWRESDALAREPLAYALPLSARTADALAAHSAAVADLLERSDGPPLRDVCFTASVRRDHFEERAVVVGTTRSDVARALRERRGSYARARAARPKLAFVFTGQGSQWWGMGRELLATEPAFRAATEGIAALIGRHAGWSLFDELAKDEASSRLGETEIAQPALFALQAALCASWRAWGVEPDAVIGHSVGEIAAAHVSGALDLEASVRLVVLRGRLMQEVTGRGKMAAVALSEDRARDLVREYGPRVGLAASNGPAATVLSGDAAALDAVLDRLRRKSVRVKELPVDYAFHSAQLDGYGERLEKAIGAIGARDSAVPIVSTSTGKEEAGSALDSAYWGRQLREPVLFHEGTKWLVEHGFDAFLEVGPHPVLVASVAATAEAMGRTVDVAASLRRGEPERASMLAALGSLHCGGYPVSWEKLYGVRGRVVSIPTYPWQRERYWLEGVGPRRATGEEARAASFAPDAASPPPRSFVEAVRRAAPGARASLVREHVAAAVAATMGFADATALDPARGLFALGMDSLMAVDLTKRLSSSLGVRLAVTAAFEHPSIAELGSHLAARLFDVPGERTPAAAPGAASWSGAIAVVGIGCRFPGNCNGPDEFWRFLRRGGDGVREFPPDRLDLDAYYDPDPEAPGKVNVRRAGLLDDVASFDAGFFGISPREAARMDPQQRLLAEVIWEALEHAGEAPEKTRGSHTAAFVGVVHSDYFDLSLGDDIDMYTFTGTSAAVLSGRTSYLLGWNGPAAAVDTACSSSLVALHMACDSLRSGQSDRAVAAGTNLILSPFGTMAVRRGLAPDGRCKTFDAAADGAGRGEGCAAVVLKRLEDAIAANDRVLAVVRGTAVNQDGATSGLTVPNGQAQESVIRRALAVAGIEPRQVGYVEAHGTGTPLGDPIEIRAIANVLGRGRAKDEPLFVASAKPNIGHLEGAAGIAGFIKAVLMLHHGEIVPHIGVRTGLNPAIDWDDLPIAIPTSVVSFPEIDGRRVAGVSSFGASGTNAHVILESAGAARAVEHTKEAARADAPPASTRVPGAGPEADVMTVSAKTPASLTALAERYAAYLDEGRGDASFAEVCRTASVGRSHLSHRLAVVARGPAETARRLRSFASGERLGEGDGVFSGIAGVEPPKVAFVFSGHGSQWAGMGRVLLARSPVFRGAIARCEEAMRPYVDWSLSERLMSSSALEDNDVIQPALFAMAVSLAELWRSWGVVPDAVIGHSMGEVAAAHVAGALSLEDAARVICVRSRLLRRVRGKGLMAAVELGLEDTLREIAALDPDMSVAASNGPRSTVVSGKSESVHALVDALKARRFFCRVLKADGAGHSAQVDPLREDLLAELAPIRAMTPSVRMPSTATPGAEPRFDASYWWSGLRNPVMFAPQVDALLREGHQVFVELSPHPVLANALEQCADARGGGVAIVSNLRRDADERESLLSAVALVHSKGCKVDWEAVQGPGPRSASLPTYAWQRRRYWIEPARGGAPRRAERTSGPRGRLERPPHPALQRYTRLGAPIDAHVWEGELEPASTAETGWIALAEAADIALAAACEAFGDGAPIADVRLHEAVPRSAAATVQAIMTGTGRTRRIALYARAEGDAEGCLFASASADVLVSSDDREPREDDVSGEAIGDVTARLDRRRALPPPLLDRALEALLHAARASVEPRHPFAIVHIDRARVYGALSDASSVHAVVRVADDDSIAGDVQFLDGGGRVVARLRGVRAERQLHDWLYRIAWRERPVPAPRSDAPETWLLLADRGGIARLVAAELERRGHSCVLVHRADAEGPLDAAGQGAMTVRDGAPTDFVGLLDLPRRPDRVVFMWGLDIDGETPPSRSTLVYGALVRLVQVLGPATRVGRSLWIVTRNAEAVTADEHVEAPHRAVLWGMARSLALEVPAVWGGAVDIGGGAPPVDRLVDQILASDGMPDDQFVLRGSKLFVPRVVPAPRLPMASAAIHRDAAYLVTGGFGTMGRPLARWLAESGAGHVVLVARNVAGAGRDAVVRELEALGATVHRFAADVADDGQLGAALRAVRALGVPLRGIFHAAGQLDFLPVDRTTPEALAAATRAKVQGTWNLHGATREDPLDLFVMFSSMSAAWGSTGGVSYGGANHFLDAMASYRRGLGLPALTVAWGMLGGLPREQTALALRMGIQSMSPVRAVRLLARLVASGAQERVVTSMDWEIFKEAFNAVGHHPIFDEIATAAEERAPDEVDLAVQLATMSPGEQREQMIAIVQEQVAKVFGLDGDGDGAARHDAGFFESGMDSIMSMQLKRRLETSVGRSLPATVAFDYPNVAALADYLLHELLGASAPPPIAPSVASTAAAADIEELARLEQMPEAELLGVLADALDGTSWPREESA